MTITTFESLPTDVLLEIFVYLSPIKILQSFSRFNKRFLTIIVFEYLWHIDINDDKMSWLIFNDFCQNVLKTIGARIISLRITFKNAIGGWSLISSAMRQHQTTLLRRLHVIDITDYEFKKLLRNPLIKQLHTFMIDLTRYSSFKRQGVEGAYLDKVRKRTLFRFIVELLYFCLTEKSTNIIICNTLFFIFL